MISGTMARVLARQGPPLLALDSDLLPGLSFSLGAGEDPALPPLRDAAEKGEDGRWRLKKGIGPARAVRRYSTAAPDGIRLLQLGKTPREGLEPIMGAVNAYYRVSHRLGDVKGFQHWTMLGDLPAGPRPPSLTGASPSTCAMKSVSMAVEATTAPAPKSTSATPKTARHRH